MSKSARATIALFSLVCSVFSLSLPAFCAPVLAGYLFPQGKQISPGELDATAITRINYAFARIQNGRIVEGFPTDAANLTAITAMRQSHPGLSVLISVGGWTWSDGFSDAALTKRSRATLVASAVEFLRRYELDGIDVDWEYPGQAGAGHTFRSRDKRNFTLLMRDLRAALNRESRKERRPLELTMAAGASEDFLQHTEMRKAQLYVDAVNLMTYDYYGPASDTITGNHAPLLTDPADPKHMSADASVRAFVTAGVPASKIVLGIPFYGRAWADVPDAQHGLFQPGRQSSLGELPYSAIQSIMLGAGFTRYWDEAAQVPYLYNPKTREFVSYEDEESAAAKSRYALSHKLQGIMFWRFFNDPSGQLLHAITQELYSPGSAPMGYGNE